VPRIPLTVRIRHVGRGTLARTGRVAASATPSASASSINKWQARTPRDRTRGHFRSRATFRVT